MSMSGCTKYLGLGYAHILPATSHLPNTVALLAWDGDSPPLEACSPNPDLPHFCAQAPARGRVGNSHWEGLGRRGAGQDPGCQGTGE